MNETRLSEIEARASAAIAPPWFLHGKGWSRRWITDERQTEIATASYERAADLFFAVHARQDVPDLVAEVRRLQAEVERLRTRKTPQQLARDFARDVPPGEQN